MNSAAQKVPAGGKQVDANGNLIHTPSGAGTGPFTKVTLDTTGHVIGGSGLDDTDIPTLDADKIVSGQFSTERIADDAITAPKLADYSTCLMQEDNPGAGDFLGQFCTHLQQHNSASTLAALVQKTSGYRSASVHCKPTTSAGRHLQRRQRHHHFVTSIGTSEGITAGQPFPAPSLEMSGLYFICQVAGGAMTQPNLNGISHTAGDWALRLDETQGWIHIDVNGGGGGGGGGAQYLRDLLDVEIGERHHPSQPHQLLPSAAIKSSAMTAAPDSGATPTSSMAAVLTN